MPKTELRSLVDQEMRDAMFPLGMYAFRGSPPFMERAEWEKRAHERKGITYFAMFEDGAPAAVAGSTAMHENLRGALYPASAVWGVATHPAARRKGYVRQVMSALLAAERESGKVLSALYPFRESFYERLGYASLPQTKHTCFSPNGTAPLLKKELGGRVVFKLLSEVYDLYREFLLKLQPQIHGMGVFDYGNPDGAQRNPAWAALAYVEDELEGVMLYTLKDSDTSHQFTLQASLFYTRNNRARHLLLEWIARHIDQVAQVEIHLPAFERPELWLTDLRVKTTLDFAPMGRVLDIARLGGMQCETGGFTVQVSDPICPWNAGCWRFETQDGCLLVSPAPQAEAQCSLSIQAVTALVYGTLDPQDFSIRGWGDPSPELQSTLRAMFPTQFAHLHEEF